MKVNHLSSDSHAISYYQIQKATEIQRQKIVQPIINALRTAGLERELSFLYKGAIRDVEVYSPSFETGLQEKLDDYERIVFLMEKQSIDVPQHIRVIHTALQQQNDLRKAVRQFENWLVGHMTYLELEGLEIETIFYAFHKGFLIKFLGLEPITEIVEDQPSINDLKIQISAIKDAGNKSHEKSRKKAPRTRKQIISARLNCTQKLSLEEWKKQNIGYRWVQEQLELGTPRKEIIYEFNRRHKKDPENYSSREGKPLSAAILSHWAKK